MRKKKEIEPARPGVVAQPPATPAEIRKIPEDWAPIWDEEFEAAFEELLPKQRQFIIEYVRCRYVKKEAFRRVYKTAYSEGIVGVILSKEPVKFILDRFTDWAKDDLFQARRVIQDAMEAKKKIFHQGIEVGQEDDHAIRLKAVEVLNKMNGNNVEKSENPPPTSGTIDSGFAVNFNFFLQQKGAEPIKFPEAKQIVLTPKSVQAPRNFTEAYQEFAKE